MCPLLSLALQTELDICGAILLSKTAQRPHLLGKILSVSVPMTLAAAMARIG
jgi:hypothetical protein